MTRLQHVAIVSSIGTLAAVALIIGLVPHITTAKIRGKPSPAMFAQQKREREEALKRFDEAASRGSIEEVKAVWNSYKPHNGFGWNVEDHYRLGIFLLKHGDMIAARKELDFVFDPPSNMRSDLWKHGEFMAYWLQAHDDLSTADRSAAIRRWSQRTPDVEGLTGEAKMEFLYGQELMIFGDTPDAVEHYRQAARLAPKSSFAHEALAGHLAEIGKKEEARAESFAAYRLAPPEERENVRIRRRLTKAEVDSLIHP